jgi:thiol-disulfide isomerase/thioredoxin
MDGTKFNIEQYRGRVVLVDFWATWCGPCRAKLPALMKLHEQYHDKGFEVVGVDLDKNVDDLGKFLDDTKLPWINLIGEQDGDEMKFPLAEKYDISAIPSTFLVGRDGRVIARDPSDEEVTKKLEELLNPGQPAAAAKPADTQKKPAKPPKKPGAESKPAK